MAHVVALDVAMYAALAVEVLDAEQRLLHDEGDDVFGKVPERKKIVLQKNSGG